MVLISEVMLLVTLIRVRYVVMFRPNMVVYNRVTNVLSGVTPPLSPLHGKKTPQPPPAESKSNLWYEYGCV